ncbi:DUF397 domain-containing protein [Streptomyces sp. ISL-100]|uniref:DUF397 domain-containing protein n=1 Tax=Streptomyces sp. ISL-100 TaxID=2819173 RepID=UPI001BE84CD6|nr:DUF397 domain-containing protein [Streptomyces sp. ISL-100]MBT2396603.1 DUF397 domain-containing protein [Streptomyces sp. ISL-100]
MTAAVYWQKSSFSGGADGNECVEVAAADGVIRLRESDEPSQVLSINRAGLTALIRHVHHVRAEQE